MARTTEKFYLTAVDQTKPGFDSVNRTLASLSAKFAAVGLAAGAAVAKLTTDAIKSADEINKLSTQLGVSTTALSELQFVASQTGVEFNQFTLAMQRSTRRVAEAAGGFGEAKGALKELGLDAVKLNRLSPDRQLNVFADALEKIKNPADQVRLAMKLFDSEGVKLLRTLKGGSDEMTRLREEAKTLGLSLTQDAADKASDVVDAFDRLKAAATGAGRSMADDLGPGIVIALDSLGELFQLVGKISGPIEKFFALFRFGSNGEGWAQAPADAAAAYSHWETELQSFNDELTKTNQLANTPVAVDVALPETPTLPMINPDMLREAVRVLEEIKTPLDLYEEKLQLLNALQRAGLVIGEDYARAVRLAGESYAEAAIAAGDFAEETATSTKVFDSIEDAASSSIGRLVADFASGTANIGDLFSSLATEVIAELTRILVVEQLVSSISGALGFSKRAAGGPVFSGQPVLVGERGPELFVPAGAGNIQPNAAGGGNLNINFTVNSLDPNDAASVIIRNANAIKSVVRQGVDRAGGSLAMV